MILKLGLAAVGVTLLVLLFRPKRPRFRIRFEAGGARMALGDAPVGFLQDVQEVCSRAGVGACVIKGEAEEGRIRLRFSSGVPEPCRQRLRNAWSAYSQSEAGE